MNALADDLGVVEGARVVGSVVCQRLDQAANKVLLLVQLAQQVRVVRRELTPSVELKGRGGDEVVGVRLPTLSEPAHQE